jgi:glycosyltransferase involved in cell wall biosynthesis
LASAVGGIVEIVVPEETGLLFEPGKPEQISAAVRRVLKDPAWARSLGEAGRLRAERQFSWASIARKTKAMYEGLVAARG